MVSELPVQSRLGTKLFVLLTIPFVLCGVMIAIFVESRSISEESHRATLAWSEHGTAVLTVEVAAERFITSLDDGVGASKAAAEGLELARSRSLELATSFSEEERAEEAEVSNSLQELVARGAAATASAREPSPEAIKALRSFYGDEIRSKLHKRASEELEGVREFSERSRLARDHSDQMLAVAIVGGIILLLLAFVLCLRIVRRVGLSLAHLHNQAIRISTGDLGETVALQSADELGQLATAFNTMAADLRSSMIHKSELETRIEARTRDLGAAEEALRQAQKLDAIGRFAGGVAHDFNNLLAVIMANACTLTDGLGLGHPLRADADEIIAASERAAGLTRQLLAFSRRQPQKTQLLSLNDVAGNLQKMFVRIIGEDIRMTTSFDSQLGSVNADVGHLEQVLTNLVVNARDAMPCGGGLTIETKHVELRDEQAKHAAVPPGEYAMISVADTGCGMDDRTRGRIFEPFFTTKDVGKGTGLGLATVFGIVKQSDGGITVESQPGVGTTFRIYLPHVDAAAAPSVISPRGMGASGTETILVVEDDVRLRSALVRHLRARGYTVLEAGNGTEALRLLAQTGEPVHLMLSDLVMPDGNGVVLSREVRERLPAIKVILMSGYANHDALDNMKLGADEPFIAKPFTIEALSTLVRDTLASRDVQRRVA